MKYSEAKQGRTFIIRLEDGDVLHEEIERFAREKSVRAATLTVLGGADRGSRLVVGPEEGRAKSIVAMEHILSDVYEVTGVGTLFPDSAGKPTLHMHIACGRGDRTVTGCVRKGVRVWHVMEIVMQELLDTPARRAPDATTGFELLEP